MFGRTKGGHRHRRDQTYPTRKFLKRISHVKKVGEKVARLGESIYLYVKLEVMKITSTLASIASLVWEAETVDQAKDTLTEHLRSVNVKDRDKMISDVEKLKTLEAVHRYVANSLLKYEGLSTKA